MQRAIGPAGPPRPRRPEGEPRHTIYSPEWDAARRRLERLDGAERALYAPLLDHVAARWPRLRPLQLAYERRPRRARATDGYGHLLGFAGSDVVDVYRGMALEAARLVPGADPRGREGDPGDLAGEAEAFVGYLRILAMASADPEVPSGFRDAVLHAAEGIAAWQATLAAMARRVNAAARRGERRGPVPPGGGG